LAEGQRVCIMRCTSRFFRIVIDVASYQPLKHMIIVLGTYKPTALHPLVLTHFIVGVKRIGGLTNLPTPVEIDEHGLIATFTKNDVRLPQISKDEVV